MSIECLTHAEYYYFRIDADYKNVIKARLKELGKPLRLPDDGDNGGVGISAYMQTMSLIKGSAKGRSDKDRQRYRFRTWRRKKFSKELAEKDA